MSESEFNILLDSFDSCLDKEEKDLESESTTNEVFFMDDLMDEGFSKIEEN